MADIKISALAESVTVTPATDVVPVVVSGITKKVKIVNLSPPVGSDKRIPFNDAGAWGSDAALTFDKATGLFTVTIGAFGSGTKAATGDARYGNVHGERFRNFANNQDLSAIETDASDFLYIGTDTAFTTAKMPATLRINAANTIIIGTNGTRHLTANGTTNLLLGYPLLGDGASSNSPYSVHGVVISAMTDAAYTVPNSEYAYSMIEVPASLTLTANRAFKLPTPATEAASYDIEASNLTTGGFSLVIGRADGAGVTYTLLSGKRANLKIRPAGAYLDTTTIT